MVALLVAVGFRGRKLNFLVFFIFFDFFFFFFTAGDFCFPAQRR